VHDAIEIERHGIPCAVIGTEPFVPTMRTTAATCGIAGYPMAIIGHPIGSLTEEGLAMRADEAVTQVLRILLSDRLA
jgi:hypothetical protein